MLERALRLLENVDSANLNTANQSSLAVDLRSELAAARQLLAKNLLLEENLSAKV